MQYIDLLKMILPWVLLFSLLTIHADNYKPTPVKVWIQTKQQRKSNQDPNSKLLGPQNRGPNEALQQVLPDPQDPNSELIGTENGVTNKVSQYTLPGHNTGTEIFQIEPIETF